MNSKFFVSNLNSSSSSSSSSSGSSGVSNQSNLISSSGGGGGGAATNRHYYPAIATTTNNNNNNKPTVPDLIHSSHLPHRQPISAGSNGPIRNCLMTLNGTLSLDSLVHSSRNISLIECGNTYGLFILMSNAANASASTTSTPEIGNLASSNAASNCSFVLATTNNSGSAEMIDNNHGHNHSRTLEQSTTAALKSSSGQLDKILPIDSRFSYEIVSPELSGALIETDVTLRLIYSGEGQTSVGDTGLLATAAAAVSSQPQHPSSRTGTTSTSSWFASSSSSGQPPPLADLSVSSSSGSLPHRHWPAISTQTVASPLTTAVSPSPLSASLSPANLITTTTTNNDSSNGSVVHATTTANCGQQKSHSIRPLEFPFSALDLCHETENSSSRVPSTTTTSIDAKQTPELCYTFLLESNEETKQFLAQLQSAVKSYPKSESIRSNPSTSFNFNWIVEDYLELASTKTSQQQSILPVSFLNWFNSQLEYGASLSSAAITSTTSVSSNNSSSSSSTTSTNYYPPPTAPGAIASSMAQNRRHANNNNNSFGDSSDSNNNFNRSNTNQTSGLNLPFDSANSDYVFLNNTIAGSMNSPLCFNDQHFEIVDTPKVAFDSLEYFNLASNQDFQTNGEWSGREQWIYTLTEDRQSEYVDIQKYRLFIGTWNVNGRMSYEFQQMSKDFLACDDSPPDFYAIGFQELDLSKEAFLFNDNKKEEFWYDMCASSLHPKRTYTFLRHIRLIGMMIIIFVSEELAPFIRNLAAETVGTGILGKMGNKGGVAIRFDLFGTSLCFVNCHLAAHAEQVDRRNQDFREINNRLLFMQFKPPRRICDHDQVYWFGDLNYRLKNISAEQAKLTIETAAYDSLLDKDQLREQMSLGNCFQGYSEGRINFKPSYKYDLNSNDWDSSEKSRPPAWCDRVLYRGNGMQLKKYRCHYELKASDHKPVSALFESQFRVVDDAKKRKVYEDVMKKLDKMENDFLPQVSIDKTEINFGTVQYRDNVSRTLTLVNTGQSKVVFNFIPKPNDCKYCKDWLQVTPYSASIDMKQKMEIRFELNFDHPSIASKLNYGIETLTDTLVLSLYGGKDIFITVLGDYKPSYFGCSLETLVRLTKPVAEITVKELKETYYKQHYSFEPVRNKALVLKRLNNSSNIRPNQSNVDLLLNLDDNSQTSINKSSSTGQIAQIGGDGPEILPLPKELFAMVDILYRFGLFKTDLFQSSALDKEVLNVRDAINQSKPKLIDRELVYAVAEALLLFLQTLPEPVIPYAFYRNVIENRNNFSNCKQVVSELPETHRRVFEYIILFLKELCKFSSQNRLDTRIAAKIFGPCLIRKPESVDLLPTSSGGQSSNQNLLVDLMSTSEQETVNLLSNFGNHLSLTPEQTFVYLFLNNDVH